MMRTAAVMGACLAVALAPAAVRAQGTFEGMVAYRMSQPGGGSAEMRYFQKGSKVRQEIDMGGMTTVSIFDATTGESIMLIPGQKQYMAMNLKDMAKMGGAAAQAPPADFSRVKVTATGRRETIAGIACEHYVFASGAAVSGQASDICGAAGMGFMGGGGQGAGALPATAGLAKATNAQLAALGRRGFFPLKMSAGGSAGGVSMEATRVERRRLDASLFVPPSAYTKMMMPSLPPMKR